MNIVWKQLCKKIDFMTLVKFSFQTLKFVKNIKSDNSIMCIWFQTAFFSDGQQKHLTAEGELFDSHNSPYAVIFVVVAHLHIMQFETINTLLGLLFKQC